MPLTKDGYKRKTSMDFKRELELTFQKYFGEELDLSENEYGGMLVGTLKDWLVQMELVAESVYNAGFVLKANGANLDDLASEENIFRKPAMPAYCMLQIDGYYRENQPIIIPANSQFSTGEGQKFVTTDDCEINAPVKDLTDDKGNKLGRTTVQAVSLGAGIEYNVVPNSIINPAQVIDGIHSVTNPNGATGGSDFETDSELRNRVIANRKSSPNETKNGIETAIKNVSGVTDARLIANNTMSDDKFGNPAKSVHLYVIGGDENDIANNFFEHLTPVATTVGNTTVEVADIAGKSNFVKFDRAETVPIYVDISIDVDETIFNGDSAISDIKTNVLNYFSQMNMGSTVLYSKLFAPAWSASGINNVSVKLGKDKNNLDIKDVPVSQFELPVTGVNLININVKGGV